MKICPRCGAENDNDAQSCRECGQKIRSAFHIQAGREEQRQDEEALRRKKLRSRHRILIPLLGIPFFFMLKIAYGLRGELFPVVMAGGVIPLVAWLKIHKGEWLYSLNRRLFKKNYTKPLEDYLVEGRITGVLLLIFCFGWLLWYCLRGA